MCALAAPQCPTPFAKATFPMSSIALLLRPRISALRIVPFVSFASFEEVRDGPHHKRAQPQREQQWPGERAEGPQDKDEPQEGEHQERDDHRRDPQLLVKGVEPLIPVEILSIELCVLIERVLRVPVSTVPARESLCLLGRLPVPLPLVLRGIGLLAGFRVHNLCVHVNNVVVPLRPAPISVPCRLARALTFQGLEMRCDSSNPSEGAEMLLKCWTCLCCGGP
mmetsp:Transcript_2910/g.5486  ORF Transcript_2910/g.5486 Transcript_2910/m.5486 type:complete len:223 (+) Transcript_2910:488-1156(+)